MISLHGIYKRKYYCIILRPMMLLETVQVLGTRGIARVRGMGTLLLVTEDTTASSYWLNWRVFLCAIWVFPAMIIALPVIWKYERREQQEDSSSLIGDHAWKPCLKEIHPIWLMTFRIVALCLLLVALSFDIALHGLELFYYYTQWTFTLVTIYFAFALVLSINGCLNHYKTSRHSNYYSVLDEEQGLLYVHLKHGANANDSRRLDVECNRGKHVTPGYASIWSYTFQVLFQMTAGAVMLTDILYWSIIFPFLNIRDYDLNFLTVIAHSLNGILFLGDTALNSLRFPWFRISYFILWTGAYVIFEWITHACINLWWPYPFMDLSDPYAPFWYFSVAFLHFPCYGIFALVVKAKEYLLSRSFPESYELLR
ncbi:hypothetical protein LIER_00395 [Lithospermum erythrorhizon]|uniref:Transmembrane protein n=1 Tax=Lithospermum erythrorhizon TaxID=34254 RepID=A0AAV3NLX0_LITER